MAIEEDELSIQDINDNNDNNDNNDIIEEEIEIEINNIFYEISFKCNTDIFKSKLIYNSGEMVIVHCERGYNVGFVLREVPQNEIHDRAEKLHFKPKKIHSRVTENIENVRDMLKSKIEVENFALTQCRAHMRGHRLGAFAEALATEFQFDHKKLIVYLKKYEEVSVCRLVRKLYDKFKTRIKVIEVQSLEDLHKQSLIYIQISKLDITLSNIFEAIQEENSSKYLLTKYQQLNSSTVYSTQITSTADENSAANIFYEYQNYRPSNRVKSHLLMHQRNNDHLSLHNDAIDFGIGKSFLNRPVSPPEIEIFFEDNSPNYNNYNSMYDSLSQGNNYNHVHSLPTSTSKTISPPIHNNSSNNLNNHNHNNSNNNSIFQNQIHQSTYLHHNGHNPNNNYLGNKNHNHNNNNHHNSHHHNNHNNLSHRNQISIPSRQNYHSTSQFYNQLPNNYTNYHDKQSYTDYLDNDLKSHFRITQVDEMERHHSYPHYVIEHK